MKDSLITVLRVAIIISIFIIPFTSFSQSDPKLYKFYPPQFGNGDEALVTFFRERINLKSTDFKYLVTGTVSIKLTLTKNKEVKDIVMIDSTNSAHFNKEILDYLWQGKGNWKVATIDGKPIDINIVVSAHLLPLDGGTRAYILNSSFNYLIDPVLINQFYNIGAELAGSNQYQSAIPYFDSVIKYFPKDVDALFNRGICYLKTDNVRKACLDWDAINKLGKPDADKLISKYCNE